MFGIYDLTIASLLITLLCAMLTGMSKTGVPGVSNFVVPVMALIYGAKASTGVLLPILIMADVLGVLYYHRHAAWKHLWRAFPWAFVGLLAGLWVGNAISPRNFKLLIGILVLMSLAIMVWRDYFKKDKGIPTHWSFAGGMGLGGGFATMIGNAAGPIMSIYLLALKLPKQVYIGTGAWFFFVVNLSKVPMQVWGWHNINHDTLLIMLCCLPSVLLGAYLGIKIVKCVPEKSYRWVVLVATVISAVAMIL